MKTITTGTKITFKETSDKFLLTQTDTGFDIKQVKLGKNVPSESYSFQEFLDMYEKGDIAIDGFEDADAGLAHSIITNYIYQTNLKEKIKEIEELKIKNTELQTQNTELKTEITTLETALEAMKEESPN